MYSQSRKFIVSMQIRDLDVSQAHPMGSLNNLLKDTCHGHFISYTIHVGGCQLTSFIINYYIISIIII